MGSLIPITRVTRASRGSNRSRLRQSLVRLKVKCASATRLALFDARSAPSSTVLVVPRSEPTTSAAAVLRGMRPACTALRIMTMVAELD